MTPRFGAFCVVLAGAAGSRAAPPRSAAERLSLAKQLASAKACDEMLLSFESARPDVADASSDRATAQELIAAAQGACASDPAIALGIAAAAGRLAPRDVEILLARGDIELKAGNPGEAAKALDAAIDLAPAEARARIARAELALAEHDPALVLKVLGPVQSGAEADRVRALMQRARVDLEEARASKKRLGEVSLRAERAAEAAKRQDKATTFPDEAPLTGEGRLVWSAHAGLWTGGQGRWAATGTRRGHTYVFEAIGYCHQPSSWHEPGHWRHRRKLAGTSFFGIDWNVEIGSMPKRNLSIDDQERTSTKFEFVADADNVSIRVYDKTTSADVHCHLETLMVTSR